MKKENDDLQNAGELALKEISTWQGDRPEKHPNPMWTLKSVVIPEGWDPKRSPYPEYLSDLYMEHEVHRMFDVQPSVDQLEKIIADSVYGIDYQGTSTAVAATPPLFAGSDNSLPQFNDDDLESLPLSVLHDRSVHIYLYGFSRSYVNPDDGDMTVKSFMRVVCISRVGTR